MSKRRPDHFSRGHTHLPRVRKHKKNRRAKRTANQVALVEATRVREKRRETRRRNLGIGRRENEARV